MNPFPRALLWVGAVAALGPLAAGWGLAAHAHGVPPVSDLDAAARAAGNEKQEAYRLGRVLFARVWPAQIIKVRVDGVGSHQVAGLVLSGVKFHGGLDVEGFAAEVNDVVRQTFNASPVEEVDLWVTVPLPIDRAQAKALVVSGDYAQPTAKTVFAVTVRRDEAAGLAERLRSGTDVFWDPGWKGQLAGRGPGRSPANPEGSAQPGHA